MGKCRNCNIEILDEAEYCPLCKTVLEQTDELENAYPDVRLNMRRLLYACRLYLFFAIIAEGILITINLITNPDFLWCAITGLALLLGYIIIRFGISGRSGYRSKILGLAIAAVLFTVGIDFIIGYRGWSLDFALPIGILAVDFFIIAYMIGNHRNWQSYIMWQLLMILLSLIPIVLYIIGLEKNPYMAFIPIVVSAVIFFGTMMIGDQRALDELKRRFHVR